jgi:hypothetical protein
MQFLCRLRLRGKAMSTSLRPGPCFEAYYRDQYIRELIRGRRAPYLGVETPRVVLESFARLMAVFWSFHSVECGRGYW